MKKLLLIAILFVELFADQVVYKKVISVKEVFKTTYDRNPIVREETTCYENDGSGGAIFGTIVGGLIGSTFGGGDGRLVATAIGASMGAVNGRESSKGVDCRVSKKTDYVETPRNVFDYYSITLEGGYEFSSSVMYRVGDKIRLRISDGFKQKTRTKVLVFLCF